MDTKLKIVFMGTPDFAAASLEALVKNGADIVGVITAPDKPKGRGKKLGTSAVKETALANSLRILQPTNLKDEGFIEELRSLEADLQIVVAFRMLPVIVWDMPRLGSFNLHASLLPAYRGAAPINWAIINGEKETGITTFFLKHEIDTGSILFQEAEKINPTDSVGEVYTRLMNKGASLTVKTLKAIESGQYTETPQSNSEDLKHAPKIFKEDCQINWNQPSNQVFNFIRGLSPYPAAWTTMHEKQIKLFKTELVSQKLPVGSFRSDGKTFMHIGTLDGALSILELQLEGKRKITIDEMLRGYQWPSKKTI
ncbi:MAG: methionyl-tRNA formyltransferase [Cyclobacteriaceae bacterium]|jgi:methionyl-tRNA formyltransferase